MIETTGLAKSFGEILAVNHITTKIRDGAVFGLVGTNGAGKSTFLRLLSGVLRPDEGTVLVDGEPVYERPQTKSRMFYISDEQYFLPGATPLETASHYRLFYPDFQMERCRKLFEIFGLDERRKIATFSKGMKKQVSIICGICSGASYLLCDEAFDGLDPVMRQATKSLFAGEMEERSFTPVIASHNLRELEDICEDVGLLHAGGILLSGELENMKLNIHKVQFVLKEEVPAQELFAPLEILTDDRRGMLHTVTLRGDRVTAEAKIRAAEPVFYELLPLSLEEIFISETEVAGYDVRKIIC